MKSEVRLDKDKRRAAMADRLRRDPGQTDQSLAAFFGVSVATVRLDRKMLGIPQLRDRLEAAVQTALTEAKGCGLEILELEKGKRGLALFAAAEDMADAAGMIPAERLYGISASLARAVLDEPFAPTQVGNIKYKLPAKSGMQLVVKAKVSRMRGDKQYIYVQITAKETEVFRAKFIMNAAKQNEGDTDGKDCG